MLGTRNRQRSHLGPRGNYDVLGLEYAIADPDGVGGNEDTLTFHNLDFSARHYAGEVGRNVPDHRLLTIDQRSPVEPRLTNCNVMNGRAINIVQSLARSDQDLLRRAAAIGTGTA